MVGAQVLVLFVLAASRCTVTARSCSCSDATRRCISACPVATAPARVAVIACSATSSMIFLYLSPITHNRTCAKRPSTDWASPIPTLTLPPSPLPPLTAFACTSRLIQQAFFTRSLPFPARVLPLPNDGNQGRLTFRPDRRRNAWIACFALPSRMWPPRPALICSPHACRAEPSLLRENHPPR